MGYYDEVPSGHVNRVDPVTKVLVDGVVKTVGSLPLVTVKVAERAWEHVEFGRGTDTGAVEGTVKCRTVYSAPARVRALAGDAYREGMTLCLREGDRLKVALVHASTAGLRATGSNRGSSAARTGAYALAGPRVTYLGEDDPPGTVGRVVNGELVGKSFRTLPEGLDSGTSLSSVAAALKSTSANTSVTGAMVNGAAQAWPGVLYDVPGDGLRQLTDVPGTVTWPPTQRTTEYWAPLVAVVNGAVVPQTDQAYVRAL